MTSHSKHSDDEHKVIKLLFIARTYPPLVGGMERFAEDFFHYMSKRCRTTLLANPRGKKYIVQFFYKTMVYLIKNSKEYDIIHFNDAILAPLLFVIRLFSIAKVTFTVHGLDIVYNQFGYQYGVIPFLRKADWIFPVSKFTKQQCIKRNIPAKKMTVIPNGLAINCLPECNQSIKELLLSKINLNIQKQKILLSLGRLIKRKGHVWFLVNVFAKLPTNFFYLIAGDGPENENIKRAISQFSLADRVKQLGYVTNKEKVCLYKLADLFIMPNISDLNDQEGFGIVLIEAASYGLPSIASNIEGIQDAVIHGVTGHLIREKDANGFAHAIKTALFDKEMIIDVINDKFNWEKIARAYYSEFLSLLDNI